MTIFSDIKNLLLPAGKRLSRLVLLFPLPASLDWLKGSVKLLFSFLIIIAEKGREDKGDKGKNSKGNNS
jgi:hypothetical protein